MSNTTTLAESQITQSPHDVVTAELIKRDGMPPIVRIGWPLQPTVCEPAQFPSVAAMVARLFATASTKLAHIKAGDL
jgi:hypothetical protein